MRQEWAVQVGDLQACLLRHEPEIVHFSGQGSPAGQLLVEDEARRVVPIAREALAANALSLHGFSDALAPELLLREGVTASGVRIGAAGPPFFVPFSRNPGFVGRAEDLAKLRGLLQKGEAVGVRPAILTGMGGIGKTQLAVEYVHAHRAAYPGGVYWVNAAADWQSELARLAIDVGCSAADAPESERWMERHSAASSLK